MACSLRRVDELRRGRAVPSAPGRRRCAGRGSRRCCHRHPSHSTRCCTRPNGRTTSRSGSHGPKTDPSVPQQSTEVRVVPAFPGALRRSLAGIARPQSPHLRYVRAPARWRWIRRGADNSRAACRRPHTVESQTNASLAVGRLGLARPRRCGPAMLVRTVEITTELLERARRHKSRALRRGASPWLVA
jgi:hypothetical protein